MNRRHFLQASAAGLTASAVPGYAAQGNEKPKRVGLIGCGWYGKIDLFRLIQVSPVEVVSLCDVDRRMLNEAAEMVAGRQRSKRKPRTYGDYRDMLKQRDLDIVLVATPDHWHALPMIAAVQAGADVFVQKPISVDVVEGQAMVAAARRHKRVVQVGTQRRSTPHLVEARDTILKENRLGRIALVEIYCYYHMRARENPPNSDPPEHLDYEMWTGPAPMRPYNSLVHPRRWRSFTEYGNGIMGDMCIHMLDMVRWMMGLGWPRRIASTGGILVDRKSRANIPDTQTATFDYGDLNVVWQHRTWGPPPDPRYPWGATFYGENGMLKVSVNSFDFTPSGKGQPVHRDVLMELDKFPEDKTERDLERHVSPAVRRHMQDFLRAIETRGRPVADIEEGHISTASCILANLSMQLGRTMNWDSEKQLVRNDEEANKLLRREYRKPWVHPEV
ncbi:MAG: Gfo/Idh/MocA family oxidoreductase [Gemmataceae bacterium]|nr:Gfo/Idh/MocA family oxidoreductase [Gemmataceae bacterium]MCI0742401.1 Gfo/Idh/MocA family oxidoreductase [Gemmataceae bacterium]